MMTEQKMQTLMQYLPEEYLEEAVAFRMAHTVPQNVSGTAKPRRETDPVPGRLLRIAVPLGAAACIAAICGLVWWAGSRDDLLTVESHVQDIDEQHPAITQTEPDATTVCTPEITTTQTAANGGLVPPEKGGRPANPTTGTDTVDPADTANGTQGTGKSKGTQQAAQTAPQQTTTTAPSLPYDPDIVAQYRLGDVNMDGKVDLTDVIRLLTEYEKVVIEGGESILTPEQLYLGNVTEERYPCDKIMYSDVVETMPVVETDYIISAADVLWVAAYYTDCNVIYEIPLYPIEDYIKYGVPPVEDFALYEAPAISMKGELDEDTAEEYIYFPAFGTLPVRIEGSEHLRLTQYNYYNASEYYGSNPYYCRLTATYYCEETGDSYITRYQLYAEGGADRVIANYASKAGYTAMTIDGQTVLFSRASNASTLYWADENWYVSCTVFRRITAEDWPLLTEGLFHLRIPE